MFAQLCLYTLFPLIGKVNALSSPGERCGQWEDSSFPVRTVFTSHYGILACSQSHSPTLREVLELSGVYGDSFRTLPSEVQYGILALVGHLMSDPVLRESVSGASTLIQERQNI